MLVDGVRHLRQPRTVFEKFQNIRRAKELDDVLCGVAQRLEQPRRDEGRKIVWLAVEHPGGLLGGEPRRQLPKQRKKALLVFAHTNTVGAACEDRTKPLTGQAVKI